MNEILLQSLRVKPHKLFKYLILGVTPLLFFGCKTKSDIRREQDLERVKSELKEAKSERADFDTIQEESRVELERLRALIEERFQRQSSENEAIKKEMSSLSSRLDAYEAKARSNQRAEEQKKWTFEGAKELFEKKKYEEVIPIFRSLIKTSQNQDHVKNAQFFMAESFFETKDFATSALEFSGFKKMFPKDTLVPKATLRQAQCFKSLGKLKEARLFFQELIEKYPKHSLAAKAKQELKLLKRSLSSEENEEPAEDEATE